MLFNWSHKKPINPLPPLSLSSPLSRPLSLSLSVKSLWICLTEIWVCDIAQICCVTWNTEKFTAHFWRSYLKQILKSFPQTFRCVSASINRQIKNGVWSCWNICYKGETSTVVRGSMWSLSLAFSFSEYTDFDNIFAPRKIATVGRNIGSVRLRPFKFQWQ